MDLRPVFPQNDVCLFSEGVRERTWKINNIPPITLNYLSRWLQSELLSVAIDGIDVITNTSPLYDEQLAERLGLIPIEADPLRMDRFTGSSLADCTERTCLIFELNVTNSTQGVMNVLSSDLRWVPIGNQAQLFIDRPPRPFFPQLLIARIYPGQSIQLRAYATLGTGAEHAKWSSLNALFSPFTPKAPMSQLVPVPKRYPTCITCEQVTVNTKFEPGFGCYYFTIGLTGGLTFEDVQRQLDSRFDWGNRYPPQPIRYSFQEPRR